MLVAPALAGVLVGRSGAQLPLLLDAASYLALVVAGLSLRTRRKGLKERKAQLVPWRLRDDRTLAILVGVLAAGIAGVSMVQVVEVFFIRDTLAASTTLLIPLWVAGGVCNGGINVFTMVMVAGRTPPAARDGLSPR
ncbi:hypothetical protein [Paractinoplanes brasiliensis]|uniref:MFS transporter n=1 Tax=Paractinoplanes brasiliensis TaxID=52695 RepID=A0A4R6JUQ7_9ACTN|nr:hypothetical protein [Actinoplanes brasiliensis]TDO39231.1 hypothetical protein C8E87_2908 [Actinoplanes brasiliensis]GID30067.1 hypothetical protein Abr02nite_50500 [Actinoplanes brasiliensis]